MKDVLLLLRGEKDSTKPREELREVLEKHERRKEALSGEREEVTEDYIEREYLKSISVSQKFIIVNLEGLAENFDEMWNREQGWVKSDAESAYSFFGPRTSLSLVEIIAGKLYPKGRHSWKNPCCEEYEGYEEAKKKADMLNASYSRTLRNLCEKGLLEEWDRPGRKGPRYYLTSRGEEIIEERGLKQERASR